ncbi:hypothetical protein L1049_007598 [Liquidambar formosana]|uniref:Wall-associated receptor kinase galacturonan-binding domain-containing protein n=1 Tax=Liquidambar formosana TaxID=63359 RepID=A0AAP0S1Q5_LIQFO
MVVELVLVLLISSLWLMEPSAAAPPMAKHGCTDSCGAVTVPYPFGIGAEQCYLEKGFEITCKESANNPPKPFLTRFDLEVLSISLENQNVTVNVPVVPICRGNPWRSANLTGSPFRFSASNSFIVTGCGNALLTNQSGAIVGGCTTTCNSSIIIDTDGCYGIYCCQVLIPSGLTIFNIKTTTEECTRSFLWYSAHSPISGDFSNSSTPVLLDWMIKSPDIFPRERLSSTWGDANGSVISYGYSCPTYYEGNPYISNGCEGTYNFLLHSLPNLFTMKFSRHDVTWGVAPSKQCLVDCLAPLTFMR